MFMANGTAKQLAEVAEFFTSVTSSIAWPPDAVPVSLPNSGLVSTATPPTLDYQARFTVVNGTLPTIGGIPAVVNTTLFHLLGFSVGDTQTLNISSSSAGAGAGAGKAALGPLTISFAQPDLTQALLSQLTSGMPITEVDVLGYKHRRYRLRAAAQA